MPRPGRAMPRSRRGRRFQGRQVLLFRPSQRRSKPVTRTTWAGPGSSQGRGLSFGPGTADAWAGSSPASDVTMAEHHRFR